jgi:hypothetical protein
MHCWADLLELTDGLGTKLAKSELKLLIVTRVCAVDWLRLASGRTLAADLGGLELGLELLQLLSVHDGACRGLKHKGSAECYQA